MSDELCHLKKEVEEEEEEKLSLDDSHRKRVRDHSS